MPEAVHHHTPLEAWLVSEALEPYYQDELVTIYHADCRDHLDVLEQADVMVTDPPYGINFEGKRTKWKKSSANTGYESPHFDDSPEYVQKVCVPVIQHAVDCGKTVVVTPGVRNAFMYPQPSDLGAIYYPSGAGMSSWGFRCSQPILYYGKDPYLSRSMGSRPNSFSETASAEKNGHPCPKQIETMRWLILRATVPGQIVVDPFMGSGTTLRAAKDLGRKSIGIEIDERYCQIAAERMAQSVIVGIDELCNETISHEPLFADGDAP